MADASAPATKTTDGITSASGIAVELGIPVTHQGVANSVRFLTGHSRNGGTDPLYVAENADDPDTTLVVYMGFSTLPSLAPKLLKHGLPPDTPAVAVERGITPQQRTVFAVLKDLVNGVKSADLVSPTLIIIGKVVALSPFWVESSEQDAPRIENSLATEGKKIAVFPVSNADRSQATSHLRYEQFQFRLVV